MTQYKAPSGHCGPASGPGHWVAERIKTEIRLETVFIWELAARVECWNLPQFQFSLPPAPKTEFKQKVTSVHLSTSEERYWTAAAQAMDLKVFEQFSEL